MCKSRGDYRVWASTPFNRVCVENISLFIIQNQSTALPRLYPSHPGVEGTRALPRLAASPTEKQLVNGSNRICSYHSPLHRHLLVHFLHRAAPAFARYPSGLAGDLVASQSSLAGGPVAGFDLQAKNRTIQLDLRAGLRFNPGPPGGSDKFFIRNAAGSPILIGWRKELNGKAEYS